MGLARSLQCSVLQMRGCCRRTVADNTSLGSVVQQLTMGVRSSQASEEKPALWETAAGHTCRRSKR